MKFMENDKLAELTAMLTDATIGTGDRVINGRIEAFTMKRAGTDKKYAHALGEKYQHEIDVVETELAQIRNTLAKQGDNSASQEKNKNLLKRGRPRSQSLNVTFSSDLIQGKTPKKRFRSDSVDFSNISHKVTPSPSLPYSNSPLGDFNNSCTRRLMTDLILTLNASFPDYDFSNVRPSHFAKIPTSNIAVNRSNEKLSELAATTEVGMNFLTQLWHSVDEVINLSESEVYSYVPPSRDDDDDPLSFLTQTLDDGSTDSTTVPLWTFNFFFVNKTLKRILFFSCVQTMRNEITAASTEEEDNDEEVRGTSLYDGYGLQLAGNNVEVDDEFDSAQDFDMDADGMGQAISVPSSFVH